LLKKIYKMGCLEGSGVPVLYIRRKRLILKRNGVAHVKKCYIGMSDRSRHFVTAFANCVGGWVTVD
jgi:hypothetical protein